MRRALTALAVTAACAAPAEAPAPDPAPTVAPAPSTTVATATTTTTVPVVTTHVHRVRASRAEGNAGAMEQQLAAIRACESGGDYGAVSRSGRYRGAYQFDQRTWEGVGGSGDPAAASAEEQDARAAQLYAERGSQPWPTCG